MQASVIEDIIRSQIDCAHLKIEGDGVHWQALVVSEQFAGKNRVARHKLVNAALSEHIETNEIHALSLRTLTPSEWDQAD